MILFRDLVFSVVDPVGPVLLVLADPEQSGSKFGSGYEIKWKDKSSYIPCLKLYF
jgi:hypothetical protein